MPDSVDCSAIPHPHEFEPLRWIGAYKLLKAALALAGGLMVLRLMHRDLPHLASRWMARLEIDPHSRFGIFVLRKVLDIHRRRLEWISAGLFAYVPLALAEGIGLMLRRLWAEWLTVITTAALIPLEVVELFRRTTAVRGLILGLNIAVVIYLIVRIRRDRQRKRRGVSPVVPPPVAPQAGGGGPAGPPPAPAE